MNNLINTSKNSIKNYKNKLIIDIDHFSNCLDAITKYISFLSNNNRFSVKNYKQSKYNRYSEDKKNVINIDYRMPFGKTNLKYKGVHMILIYKRLINNTVGIYMKYEYPETLKIIYYGSKKKFYNFVKDAIEYSEPTKSVQKIICKTYKHGNWTLLSKIDKRSLDTIFLKNDEKEKIVNDIKNFKNNRKKYKKFGIPYKRNYLLEGIPGTGKTSLILALASHYNMTIYIINVDKRMEDNTFIDAISNIANNCILLLEDIDFLFDNNKQIYSKYSITFSGILNTLDGLSRREGLIIFMTTNHIEKLDKSLLRTGRIDYNLHFDYCDKKQTKKIYDYFISDDNFSKFFKKIRHINITCSILYKFLFEYDNFDKIMENINIIYKLSEKYNKEYSLYS